MNTKDEELIIYKYFNLSSEYHRKNLEKLITNNEIWFSTNDKLNDPYEANPVIDFDIEKGELVRRFQELGKISDSKAMQHSEFEQSLRQFFLGLSKYKIRQIVESEFTSNIKKNFVGAVKDVAKLVGIASFSNKINDPAIWAHYANNHFGACVKIKIDRENLINEVRFKEVDYRIQRPKFLMSNLISGRKLTYSFTEGHIDEYFFVKSESWKFENENRMLVMYDVNKHSVIKAMKVEGIIFGLNTTKDDIKIFGAIARKLNLKVLKTELNQSSFILDITKYK